MGSQAPSAGWYQDPGGPGLRYWDGTQWTRHVRSSAQVAAAAQPAAAPAAPAAPAAAPVQAAPGPPAGWHPDPTRRFELRYWDGTAWSEHVATSGGWRGTDPIGSPGAVPAQATAPLPAAAPLPGYGASPSARPAGAAAARRPSWFALAGGAATIVGTLLPWLSAALFGQSANAFDIPAKVLFSPDNPSAGGIKLGIILVVLGAAAIGLAFVPAAGIVRRIVGAVVAAAVIVFVVQLVRTVDNNGFQFIGPGVWVTLAGGLVTLGGK